jgi:hypothetical protein
MIDDKKIEAVKEEIYEDRFLLNGEEVVFDNDAKEEMFYKDDIKEAIGLGAHWAINEFIKNLWHPANKIPKKFNHYGFAALYILQYNHQIRMVLYDKDNMSWKNVISNSEYWLYVDDLLPKQEGGEQ